MSGPRYVPRHQWAAEAGTAVSAAKFSANGLWLAVGTAAGDLFICNALTAAVMHRLVNHRQGINAVSWSPDSIHIASASDDCQVFIWDALAGKLEKALAGHAHFVFCVAYNPLGNLIASGSFDETIRLWETKAGRLLRTFAAHDEAVTAVDFSFDGTLLLSASYDGMARLWDVESGMCLKTICRGVAGRPSTVVPIAHALFSPNAKYLVAVYLDSCIKLWRWASNTSVATYRGHSATTMCIMAEFLMYRPGETYVLSGSENGNVYVWGLQSKEVVATLDARQGAILGAVVNPRIHLLVSFGPNGFALWMDRSVHEGGPHWNALLQEQEEVLQARSSKAWLGRGIPIYPHSVTHLGVGGTSVPTAGISHLHPEFPAKKLMGNGDIVAAVPGPSIKVITASSFASRGGALADRQMDIKQEGKANGSAEGIPGDRNIIDRPHLQLQEVLSAQLVAANLHSNPHGIPHGNIPGQPTTHPPTSELKAAAPTDVHPMVSSSLATLSPVQPTLARPVQPSAPTAISSGTLANQPTEPSPTVTANAPMARQGDPTSATSPGQSPEQLLLQSLHLMRQSTPGFAAKPGSSFPHHPSRGPPTHPPSLGPMSTPSLAASHLSSGTHHNSPPLAPHSHPGPHGPLSGTPADALHSTLPGVPPGASRGPSQIAVQNPPHNVPHGTHLGPTLLASHGATPSVRHVPAAGPPHSVPSGVQTMSAAHQGSMGGPPMGHSSAPGGHPGAPGGHPGAPGGHSGAPIGHSGAPVGHPGAPARQPGAPLGHPGIPMTGPPHSSLPGARHGPMHSPLQSPMVRGAALVGGTPRFAQVNGPGPVTGTRKQEDSDDEDFVMPYVKPTIRRT